MKAKEQLEVGKNNIGYVDSDFIKEFGEEEITPGKVLKFQKLGRSMTDSQIISEFKIEECTLGDVLETMKNAPEELKDGYSNLFYVKDHLSHVVYVVWRGDGWHVLVWLRGDRGWHSVRRVFFPATADTGNHSTGPESTLPLDICDCKRCEFCGKRVVGKELLYNKISVSNGDSVAQTNTKLHSPMDYVWQDTQLTSGNTDSPFGTFIK